MLTCRRQVRLARSHERVLLLFCVRARGRSRGAMMAVGTARGAGDMEALATSGYRDIFDFGVLKQQVRCEGRATLRHAGVSRCLPAAAQVACGVARVAERAGAQMARIAEGARYGPLLCELEAVEPWTAEAEHPR